MVKTPLSGLIKRSAGILLAVAVVGVASGLTINLFPDHVYGLYSGARRWVSWVNFESRRWAAAAIGPRERLPVPRLPSPAPIVPYGSAKPGQAHVEWAGHVLYEVKTLKALPQNLRTILGVEKTGLDGIADRDGRYNATDAVDPNLPWRRFIVAGMDGDAALIAVEHGGFGWFVDVTLFSNINDVPIERRAWGLYRPPRTLQTLVKAISAR